MMNWLGDSRLFVLARQSKRLPHWAVSLAVAIAILLLANFAALPLLVLLFIFYGPSAMDMVLGGFQDQPPLLGAFWQSVFLVFSFGSIMVLLALWVTLVEKRSPATLGFERSGWLQKYVRGFGVGILMMAGVVGVLALFGSATLEETAVRPIHPAALGGVLIIGVGWLVQGAAEEALTRGWMLPTLGVRYRPWVGILISSLVFAVFHGLNPNLNALALINLALFGLFAALYALREGSLWGISALHSAWNWAQGNLFGLEVSGVSPIGGSMLNLMETGPDWFTGGAFGPEAGLAVTLVLCLGIGMLLVGLKERRIVL